MILVVFPFAWWLGQGPLIASAVGISLISITTLAATAGAILPSYSTDGFGSLSCHPPL